MRILKSTFKAQGLAAVELAILIAIFIAAAIIFGTVFTKVRLADRQNEYLYTFNSLPNPDVYQYGLEGELEPKTDLQIAAAVDEMRERINFGTRGGDSCVMAFRLKMNNANYVNGCPIDQIEIENNAAIDFKGSCNCNYPSLFENIKNLRNPDCSNTQIVFLAHMPAESADAPECKIMQLYPGGTKKFAKPYIYIY